MSNLYNVLTKIFEMNKDNEDLVLQSGGNASNVSDVDGIAYIADGTAVNTNKQSDMSGQYSIETEAANVTDNVRNLFGLNRNRLSADSDALSSINYNSFKTQGGGASMNGDGDNATCGFNGDDGNEEENDDEFKVKYLKYKTKYMKLMANMQ